MYEKAQIDAGNFVDCNGLQLIILFNVSQKNLSLKKKKKTWIDEAVNCYRGFNLNRSDLHPMVNSSGLSKVSSVGAVLQYCVMAE